MIRPLTIFAALLWVSASAAPVKLASPDGKLSVAFELKDADGFEGCPLYRVDYRGQGVLGDSKLGLELKEGTFKAGLKVARAVESSSDTTWEPVCAERKTVRDHYNQVVIDLEELKAPARKLQLTFRAYNEGIAFCYTLPRQEAFTNFTVKTELTQFAFLGDHVTWAVYQAQGYYDASDERQRKNPPAGRILLSQIQPGVERPLTVEVATNLFVALTEARLVDFARMKFRPVAQHPATLEAQLDGDRNAQGAAQGTTPYTTPWRVIMVAPSPGQLLEQNYLILNLNEPCALADTTWIKPGKVMRESSLSTAGGKACIDFAVEHGLQFIEYDAGWYGEEYDPKSDASAVHLDPKRNPNPNALNLSEVIAYGRTKGIGVILYVNHLAMEKQLDQILPLYQEWGVKGVKYGFVNVGSQHWTRWLHEAIRKAADHKLMVDIHDEYRSTGYQRTYPNLMTVEGVAGNETFPSPVHNAVLPFTRYLTGPADYTFCWYNNRLKPTHAHQLAISTIYFSPWQFLFWYDFPTSKPDAALEYWKQLPTTWDETRVLKGEIGNEVCVARRKGESWFVGAIHARDRATVGISLDFLGAGKYTATTYADRNPDDPSSKEVTIARQLVERSTQLEFDLPANGGSAIQLVPVPQ